MLEVTLQGEDPQTRIPLYRLTCRGAGGGVGEAGADRKKERRMMDKALSTLRKVVPQRHVDPNLSAAKFVAATTDLRRARTMGGAADRAEDRGKQQPCPAPFVKSTTGIVIPSAPRRTDTPPAEPNALQRPNTIININSPSGDRVLCSENAADASGLRDTRASRFDTDATLIFNDVSSGTWEEPRKHKRGVSS